MSEVLSAPTPWGRAVVEELGEAHFQAQLFDEAHPDRDPLVSARLAARRGARAARARSRTYRAHLPRRADDRLPSDAVAVLERAGEARAAIHAAQVAELSAALEWASLHPATQPASQAQDRERGGEQGAEVAGEGAPLVAEFCLAELGLCLGVATDTARSLVGDAVELAHRLPATWARLLEGGVPVYRARRVAQASRALNPAAAAHLDGVVAPLVHTLGTAALDAAIAEATWRHDLQAALTQLAESNEHRGVRIDLRSRGVFDDGTVPLEARLDRADAIELDAAIAHLAHQLLESGSGETLDVRRSQALGMLARGEDPGPAPRRRQVVLHVHLSEAATATLEGHDGPVLVAQVRDWLTAPGSSTHVTIKPVVDLNARLDTTAYQAPERLAEQIALRDRSCVFPHCTRNARACDLDHITPHDAGGPTSSDNLAPLCRRHHRLKTHAEGWTYRMLHPGTYLWTSPHGHRALRDPTGTHGL